MKVSEIVKPSSIDDFIRLQISCIATDAFVENMDGMRFLARLDHQQSHLPGKPVVELLVIFEIVCTPATQLSFLVTERIETALGLFDALLSGKEIACELGVAWVALHEGLDLQPMHIPKPWGQEIWYTGIESRGVSQVQSKEGVSPLDWVLAAAPEHLLGQCTTPILLKILDPLPDEVFGDLYFEMHEIKQEVYVVTDVDQQAWPNGEGGIRFGFDQSLRKSFASDEAFKQAYLQAVKNYQHVRTQIDNLLDKKLSPPVDLVNQEKSLRQKMESFIAIKNIRLGDVITVPCFTPHSLQHGVRTVEFQTPVYERKILSFAQKVLTQNHWDTEEALKKIDLDAPVESPLTVLEKTDLLYREQVVQFNDFRVERVTLNNHGQVQIAAGAYRLVLVISGVIHVAGQPLYAGQAKLIPACVDIVIASIEKIAVVLIAEPL